MSIGAQRTRVLVCDGSPAYADALRRLLEHDGDIAVTCTHESAESAIAAIPRALPDLVTMDVKLPGIDGLEAVGQIMSAHPVPILVLSAEIGSGPLADAALAAGALETMPKHDLDVYKPESPAAIRLRKRAKVLARVPVIRHPRTRLQRSAQARRRAEPRAIGAIGICASTGGPQALAKLLSALPRDFPVPVLVVQHISPGFTEGFAHWLDGAVPLDVKLAGSGSPAPHGVWLAPEDAHLVLDADGLLDLDRRSVVGHHRPSGDVLLRSLAERLGSAAAGVVLSGMGNDGAEGIAAIRAAGGMTIAQDEATSIIYGMPRRAAERGAELVLGLDEIAPALIDLVGPLR